MRSLASIQTIDKIIEIPNANSIELITFKNIAWQCVAKKNEFKPGDFCVYFEIDSLLPKDNPIFAFMEPRKFKVKTVKFMSEYLSQGLALPMSAFPEINISIVDGADVTEILKIEKYDKENPDETVQELKKNNSKLKSFIIRYKFGRIIFRYFTKNKPTGNFPTHICSVTDETRIQNIPGIIEEAKGKTFIVSEKLEGQSSTYILEKSKFGIFNFYVCSRNKCYPTKIQNNFWYIADKYKMKEYLTSIYKELKLLNNIKIKSIAVQGEIIGPKIQKNIYKLNDLELYVFNIIVNCTNNYKLIFNPEDINKILFNIVEPGKFKLTTCPIIGKIILGETEGTKTIDELLKYATGNTAMCDGNVLREGIIFRSMDMQYSFKAVSNEYLLKNGF